MTSIIISPPDITDDQLLNSDQKHENNLKMVDYYSDLIIEWLDTNPFIIETDEMLEIYPTLNHVKEFLTQKMEPEIENHVTVFFNNNTDSLTVSCNHQVVCHLHIAGYDLLEETLVDG